MSITRNLNAEIRNQGQTVVVEIYNDSDKVFTCSVPNRDGFVRSIDRKLAAAAFNRTTAYNNHGDRMTFVVDYYGN